MGWRISFGIGPLRYSARLGRRRRGMPYQPRGFVVTAADLDAIRAALYRGSLTMEWFRSIPDAQKVRWMKANGIRVQPPAPVPSSVYDPRFRRG